MKHPLFFPDAVVRLLALATLIHATSLRAADEVLPVDCPGFGRTAPILNGPPGWPALAPSLVVLGTSKLVKDNGGSPSLHRITIEKVLFGHYEGKEVDYTNPWSWEGCNIYFLSPAPYKGPAEHEWWDMMDPSELKAAQELCDNRFDGIVLGADTIFVGTEVPPAPKPGLGLNIPPGTTVINIGGGGFWDDYTHEVKVVRQLSGKPLKAGDSITAIIDGFIRFSGGAEEPVHPEERIYFATGPMKDQVDGRAAYRVTPMPVQLEAQVKEALARRDSYPVATDTTNGTTVTYREILLRGSMEDAIELLNSDSDAAVDLAQKYFIFHPDDARKALSAKIADGMFATGVAKGNEFRTQQRLINCLDMVELKSPAGAIAALIEQMLAKLEKETPSVPVPARDPKKHESEMMGTTERIAEEDTTDVNHSLMWLLMKMDEVEAAARWGARLQALSPRLGGWWRHKADLADTVARVRQNETLATLTARMKDVKPVTFISPLGERGEVGAVAVSPDGRFVATSSGFETEDGSTIIRNAADFKKIAEISMRAEHLAFSPDGGTLYLFGGNEKGAIFSSYDWRTGKLIKCYTDAPSSIIYSMILTHDGDTMLTFVGGDKGWLVWDIRSGKITRTIASLGAISPDGKSFADVLEPKDSSDDSADDPCSIVVNRLDGTGSTERYPCRMAYRKMAFTPDSRYLVGIGSVINNCTIECLDLRRKGKVIASLDFAGSTNSIQLAISPDGKYAAVGDGEYGDGSVCVYSLPSMIPAWSTHFRGSARDLAFSPDSKTLYIANSNLAPLIIDMATFREVIPYTGHPCWPGFPVFSADGNQITTFGLDRTICHWSAATLEITARIQTPPGYHLISVEPSGHYAMYLDSSARMEYNDKSTMKVKTVDAATGNVASTLDIPVGTDSPRGPGIYWLPGGEALVFGERLEDVSRIDYVHGRVLNRVDTQHLYFDGDTFLSGDHASLLFLPGKRTQVGESVVYQHDEKTDAGASILDLAVGKVTPVAAKHDGDKCVVDGRVYNALTSFLADKSLPNMPQLQGVDDAPAALSPDGRRFVRYIEDDYLRYRDDPHHKNPRPSLFVVYDTATMQGVCAFHSTHGGHSAAFSPDATRLAVAGDGGSLEVWPLPNEFHATAEEMSEDDAVRKDSARAICFAATLCYKPLKGFAGGQWLLTGYLSGFIHTARAFQFD